MRANRKSVFHRVEISMSLNFQEFGRKLGRRSYDRIIIPGAIVSWVLTGQKSFSDQTSPLSDITKGGLSFLTNDPPTVGSEITLRIFLPKKTGTFDLIGKVIYSRARGPRLTYGYRIGVELIPFTQTDGCNSLQSLSMIEALIRKYGKRKWK